MSRWFRQQPQQWLAGKLVAAGAGAASVLAAAGDAWADCAGGGFGRHLGPVAAHLE